jgi:hypothetical protein
LVSLLAGGLVACGDSSSPTAPTTGVLSAELQNALQRSIQDEYRAETIYQGVLNDLGSLLPFVNVLTAEQRHSATIGQLYTNRGLSAPSSDWTMDRVPHFSTVSTACEAAAAAERANIAMYDDLLGLDLPYDVRQVFTNNRSASLVNHLPPFERCS